MNNLINLTSIRALYQEHLRDMAETKEYSKLYELQKSLRQRQTECKELGYSTIMLDMSEDGFDSWLKAQLEKGVHP